MELKSKLVMKLHVTVEAPRIVGRTHQGMLVIIPITGGTFEGPGLKGKVCPGGADWNTRISETHSHVFAKYWLETDDGEIIAVENEGVIDNQRFETTIIKTSPRFEAGLDGKYAHLASGVYVGELNAGKEPNAVSISVYKME